MAKIRPYTLDERQELVEDAKHRYQWRHQWFSQLEMLYRTGKSNPLSETTVTGTIFERLSPSDLETMNMVLPHLNIIIASVVARDPKPIAVPYSGGEIADQTAKVAEAVTGYWWSRINAMSTLRDMAQDMVVLGNGFCKVGWKLVEREVPRDAGLIAEDMTGVALAESGMAIDEDRPMNSVSTMTPYVDVTEKIVESDEPFVEYVSPYDIYFPQNARRLEEARWVAQRIVLPIDEIKANTSFKNINTVVSDGMFDYRERELGRQDSLAEEKIYETATIYEFYDMRTRTLTVFQLGSDKALFEGPIPYKHRYSPYVQMRNYSDGGNEIWAFGDLENIASLQEKLNEAFTEQVDNMRRSGNKYIASKDVFDAISRDRLESDEPDIVVEVDIPVGMTINEVFAAVPRAPLPADVYNAQAKFEDAMRNILGINDFQAGGVGADRMSAYAAAVVDGVATLRAKDKQLSVERAAAHVFNLIIRLCQEFMDGSKAIRLVGTNGGVWAEINEEVLTGEFDMHVEGGSLSAVNPATRQARAMDMLNVVVPQIANFGYDPEPALRHIVRDLGYDPDQFLKKTPPPEAPPAPEAPAAPAPEEQAPPETGMTMADMIPAQEAPGGIPPEMMDIPVGVPSGPLPEQLPPTQSALADLEALIGGQAPPVG